MLAVVCPLYVSVKLPPVTPPPKVSVCKLSMMGPSASARRKADEPTCKLFKSDIPCASAMTSSFATAVGSPSTCEVKPKAARLTNHAGIDVGHLKVEFERTRI